MCFLCFGTPVAISFATRGRLNWYQVHRKNRVLKAAESDTENLLVPYS